nr:PD40 domain-containing protein [Bacteroidota bacterium]
MKGKAIIIVLLLSYITVSTYAQKEKVEVTYVGNAGFLINIGDKKILIDALFKGFAGEYEIPQEIQDKLAKAQAPFDDVDLILVTHAHGDHIDPDMVRQHLQNNPKAIFASTQQLVDALNDSTNRWIGFKPTKEKSESKVINGISVEAFYLPHGTDARIINIGFLISVNGVTVFQTGDVDFDQFTFEEFRSLQLPEKMIDLSFIQHFYLTNDSLSKKFVNDAIGGRYIIPIHYYFTTPPFDTNIVRQNYPDAIIFKEELQSWQMPLKEIKFSNLRGDYFGQAPPGEMPVVFAPGTISTDTTIEHGSPTFSPDGNEVFWQSNLRHQEKETEILCMTMRQIDGRWTKPETSPFGGMPAFSLDGKRLYFLPQGKEKDIPHFVEKQRNGWVEPKPVGIIDNSSEPKNAYALSFTRNGTVYFFGQAEDLGTMNNFGIYRAEFIDGEYAKAELLPQSINAIDGVLNWTPFIAPDESYLLFSSNRLNAQQDIFISFRRSDGTWTEAYNLGETINTNRGERFPTLSPDGKYLFFTRWVKQGNEDVMWVSAKIIDEVKKDAFNPANEQ